MVACKRILNIGKNISHIQDEHPQVYTNIHKHTQTYSNIRTPIQVSCDISSGVAQRVVSARSGPRLKGMGVLDIEKDALLSETTGFECKPILATKVES